MNDFLVIYNNGHSDSPEKINKLYMHQHEIGVVRHIFNLIEGTQWVNQKWVPVTNVNI